MREYYVSVADYTSDVNRRKGLPMKDIAGPGVYM